LLTFRGDSADEQMSHLEERMRVETRIEPGPITLPRRRGRPPRAAMVFRDGDTLVTTAERAKIPPVATVFRRNDALHHTRCTRRIDFVGMRGGIEFDFYCIECREHVTLTQGALPRIPEGQPTD